MYSNVYFDPRQLAEPGRPPWRIHGTSRTIFRGRGTNALQVLESVHDDQGHEFDVCLCIVVCPERPARGVYPCIQPGYYSMKMSRNSYKQSRT